MQQVVDSSTQDIRPEWILAYILMSRYGLEGQGDFAMFEEEPLKSKQENAAKMAKLLEILKKF
jgi:hypothetical protein